MYTRCKQFRPTCISYLMEKSNISHPTISSETHWNPVYEIYTDDSIPIFYRYFLAHIRFGILLRFYYHIYTWIHDVVVKRYICLFCWKGLITSPNGNQVEWMCNGKRVPIFFRNVHFDRPIWFYLRLYRLYQIIVFCLGNGYLSIWINKDMLSNHSISH